jgi:bifunctional non-homologous end joining protein LigD
MPAFVAFQHPRLVKAPPVGSMWVHEVKLDGYRLQARIEHGAVLIHTRNGHDWTDKVPELAAELAALPDAILDGELCALNPSGQPDVSLLRASMRPGGAASLVLYVFDLLWHGGEDLRPYALEARKRVLGKTLQKHQSPRLRLLDRLPGQGNSLLDAAYQMGLEAIVSKRLDAPYGAGRGDTWVKSKRRPGQAVVIGGWREEPGRHFKALLVGVREGQALRYAGSVKMGFAGSSALLSRLRALESAVRPFTVGSPPRKRSDVHWARPELVANVEFAEWTASGKLRRATFKGLRDDSSAAAVVENDAK